MAGLGWDGYLVGFALSTWGQDGENLGSDEAETILVAWSVFNTRTNSIDAIHSSLVQPRDMGKVNWETLKEKGFTEHDLRSAPPLHDVLAQFEGYITKIQTEGGRLALITDGQLPVRQVLHPEAGKKGIRLSPAYWSFFDLRKEFRRLFPGLESLGTLSDVMGTLGLERDESLVGPIRDARELVASAAQLAVKAAEKGESVFVEPEEVQSRLLTGVCRAEDLVDGNTIVRARGLPWQSTDKEVAQFFVGLNIAKGGVALCLSSAGRRNGEALVRFEDVAQRDMALRRHRHFMDTRYIEIYRASAEDFLSIAAGDNDVVQRFLAKDAPVIIRMRGLPYDSTPQQIIEFFQREDGERIDTLDGEDGILFVNRADGRATGDAFVLLSSEEDCVKATNRQKQYIGTRYIELFRTTPAEVQQVINNSMDSGKGDGMGPSGTPGLVMPHPGLPLPHPQLPPQINQMVQAAVMPQQLVIQGRSRDCIRLRGLPYEALVQHILDFLGDYSKHIVYQGVHMVYNAQGQASGEAFIQMDTEGAAHQCAEERHNKYMQIGKKQRYIEVFQCSPDDMNLVLTGPGTGQSMQHSLPLSPGTPSFPPTSQYGFANPAMAQALLQAQHSNLLAAQMAAQQRLMCPSTMANGMAFGGLGSPTSPGLGSPSNPSQALFNPTQQFLMAHNAALLQMQAANGGGFGGLMSPGSQGGSQGGITTSLASNHRGPVLPGMAYPSPAVSPNTAARAAAFHQNATQDPKDGQWVYGANDYLMLVPSHLQNQHSFMQ